MRTSSVLFLACLSIASACCTAASMSVRLLSPDRVFIYKPTEVTTLAESSKPMLVSHRMSELAIADDRTQERLKIWATAVYEDDAACWRLSTRFQGELEAERALSKHHTVFIKDSALQEKIGDLQRIIALKLGLIALVGTKDNKQHVAFFHLYRRLMYSLADSKIESIEDQTENTVLVHMVGHRQGGEKREAIVLSNFDDDVDNYEFIGERYESAPVTSNAAAGSRSTFNLAANPYAAVSTLNDVARPYIGIGTTKIGDRYHLHFERGEKDLSFKKQLGKDRRAALIQYYENLPGQQAIAPRLRPEIRTRFIDRAFTLMARQEGQPQRLLWGAGLQSIARDLKLSDEPAASDSRNS